MEVTVDTAVDKSLAKRKRRAKKPSMLRNTLLKAFCQSGYKCTKAIFLVIPVVTIAVLLPSCGLISSALSLGLVKLRFGCLPQGTLIDTAEGPVKIETLKSGDTVIGFHGTPVQITQIHQYREDPATSRYVTLHFSNGSSVSASPRHRIDGKPASSLQAGDTCGSLTVLSIGSLQGVTRSFDLLTEDPGYRIGGIPVNSMIEEMAGRCARK